MNDNGKPAEVSKIADEAIEVEKMRDPRQYPPEELESDYTVEESKPKFEFKFGMQNWTLAALSPFIYLLLGAVFGWWAWAWVIIPICGIIGTPMAGWIKLTGMSPFIYILLGFLFGGSWWAWGWMIVPICGILSSGVIKKHE